jgi:hypothetical protein
MDLGGVRFLTRSGVRVSALDGFIALDRWTCAEGVGRLSLDPLRESAMGFEEIAVALDFPHRDPRIVEAIAALADALVRAVAEHFPENLFADYAALVEACIIAAERSREPLATVAETGRALVDLQALFGRHSTIRFRYVHDFLNGYDWVKWVQRDPSVRADVGPYAMPFLRHMLARGHEMLGLIASDDRAYPRLRDARPRNPFRFDREPTAEAAIHRELALRDELPLRPFLVSARGDARAPWQRPYQDLRLAAAERLGHRLA